MAWWLLLPMASQLIKQPGVMEVSKMCMKIVTTGLAALWCLNAQSAQFTVFGADRTEGYSTMTETAMAIAIDRVKRASEGDEVVVRWISDRSYQPDQAITHLKVPEVNLPKVINRFDKKGKRRRAVAINKYKHHVSAVKISAINALKKQCVGSTMRTDIIGFITAAAELFAAAPDGKDKLLVLATDLNDNRKYRVDIDLHGAHVQVYLLRSVADPAQVMRIRDHWSGLFNKWGAAQVDFLWPSLEQTNWENEQCPQ